MTSAETVNLFATTPGILYSIQESNVAGLVILAILLLGSLFSWSVMITKFSMVNQVRRQTARFLKRFREGREPLALFFRKGESYPGSPAFYVYRAGSKELLYHLCGSTDPGEDDRSMLSSRDKISPVAMGAVRSSVEREVGEQALRMEKRMILLATVVSGGPFLGLLGTVWGVMDTFADVGATGRADLAVMAPGMAGAMVTTVTGLLVAIPAMFGYNYLVTSIRSITVELENFAAELISAFEHKYLNTR